MFIQQFLSRSPGLFLTTSVKSMERRQTYWAYVLLVRDEYLLWKGEALSRIEQTKQSVSLWITYPAFTLECLSSWMSLIWFSQLVSKFLALNCATFAYLVILDLDSANWQFSSQVGSAVTLDLHSLLSLLHSNSLILPLTGQMTLMY